MCQAVFLNQASSQGPHTLDNLVTPAASKKPEASSHERLRRKRVFSPPSTSPATNAVRKMADGKGKLARKLFSSKLYGDLEHINMLEAVKHYNILLPSDAVSHGVRFND